MSVQVNHYLDSTLSGQFGKITANSKYLGVHRLFICVPVSIEIASRQVRTVVSNHDSVGVYHRNYFYHEIFSKVISLTGSLQHLIDKSLHNPAAYCLSRVLSGHKNNGLSIILSWQSLL